MKAPSLDVPELYQGGESRWLKSSLDLSYKENLNFVRFPGLIMPDEYLPVFADRLGLS
jgi:hypothetical protein